MKSGLIFATLISAFTPAMASSHYLGQCQVKNNTGCQYLETGLGYCLIKAEISMITNSRFEVTLFKSAPNARYAPETLQATGKLSLEGVTAQWDEGDSHLTVEICQQGKCPGSLTLEQDFPFEIECE